MIKEVITALKNQLTVYPALAAYASDSGYIAEDPYELVQSNKMPFFNINPQGQVVEKLDDMSFTDIERHTMQFVIQFATRAMAKNVAVMGDDTRTGILDFMDDIWSGIISDRTIGGTVDGITPGYAIAIDVIELEDQQRIFVAGAEMIVEFFRDVAL